MSYIVREYKRRDNVCHGDMVETRLHIVRKMNQKEDIGGRRVVRRKGVESTSKT